MEKYTDILPILKSAELFIDVSDTDLLHMLNCLLVKTKTFEKNTYIVNTAQPVMEVGIVLSGRVNIIREDYWGNRNILTTLTAGELFGEAFACAQTKSNLYNIIAAEKTKVMLLNYKKITSPCRFACRFHAKLIQNMMFLIARKNIMLTTKIEHLTQKTTRSKLLSYLSSEAIRHNSNVFSIPFDRQELADYLSVERSAMSAELSRMQKAGLIEYHKNEFKLAKSVKSL